MEQFDKHFLMDMETIQVYAKMKLNLFAPDEPLICQDLGDGNINYVYRLKSAQTGKSYILKHADTRTRSKASEVSLDRIRIEAEALMMEGELAPGFVPEVYYFDITMGCIVMQDLYDYENLRTALCNRKQFPKLADDITTFMAQTLIRSTDLVIPPEQKREMIRRFINPSLCAITERKVFNDPFSNFSGRNKPFELVAEFLEHELYEDDALRLEAAKLKEIFKNSAQALIHGDLHTGSIMVRQDSTMVLDPEFAFYGPIGYDVGNVIANLIFAWISAYVDMDLGEERDAYLKYLADTITVIPDLFREKALKIIYSESTEHMTEAAGVPEWYLDDVLTDTAGFAALELIRRIIGSAKVKGITEIRDKQRRAFAEKFCIRLAKDIIFNRGTRYHSGDSYTQAMQYFLDVDDHAFITSRYLHAT